MPESKASAANLNLQTLRRVDKTALGFGVALFLGFTAGFFPAWSAYRARITDMLRTV